MNVRTVFLSLAVVFLSACGGGGGGDSAGSGPSHQALLQGPLEGATVKLYPLDNLADPLKTTRTDDAGQFALGTDLVADDYYLLEISGGSDAGTASSATLHALAQGAQLTAGAVVVSPLSDIAWRYSRENAALLTREALGLRLDDIALTLLQDDISGDDVISAEDLLVFDPRNAANSAALGFDYEALMTTAAAGESSVLVLYRSNDEEALVEALDDALGTRLSPYAADDAQASEVRVKLLSYGEGDVYSEDGLITFDSDAEDSARTELLYPRSENVVRLQATPKAGSKIAAWSGCDKVSEDLAQCEFAPDGERQIVVSFSYDQRESVPNLVDLSGIRIAFLDDERLAASFSEEGEGTQRVASLVEGDFIAGDTGEGFLRRVVSVETLAPTEYIITTEEATLEDVTEEGSYEFAKVMTNGDLDAAEPEAQADVASALRSLKAGEAAFEGLDGIELVPSASADDPVFTLRIGAPADSAADHATRKLTQGKSGSLDGTVVLLSKNGVDQVRARGEIKLRIQLDYGLSYKRRKLKYFKFVPVITAEEKLDLHALTGVETADRSVKLGTIRFNKIRIFPLVFRPKVDLYLGLDGKIAGKLDTSFNAKQTIRAGLIYRRGKGFSRVTESVTNTDFDTYSDVVGVAMSTHVKAVPSIKLYGKTGPALPLRAYLKLRSVEFGEQTSNYWKSQRCVTGMDNTAWAGVEGEVKWLTTGKIRTKLGRSIVDRLKNIEQVFLRREWQLARWEVGAGCLGPLKPAKMYARLEEPSWVSVSQFSNEPITFSYRLKNVGEREMRWGTQPFAPLGGFSLSKSEGVLAPGAEEVVTGLVDLTQVTPTFSGEYRFNVLFRNLSASQALQNRGPLVADITGDTRLQSSVFIQRDAPPVPQNLVAERKGRDFMQLHWDYPLASLNLDRLAGYRVVLDCQGWEFAIHLVRPEVTSYITQPLPLNSLCMAKVVAYARDGGRSGDAISNTVLTGDIITNPEFVDGLRGWTGVEHGSQKVVDSFFGQVSEDGHMLLSATLGGTPYTGVFQTHRIPETVDTMDVRFKAIYETTRLTGQPVQAPSMEHEFYIALVNEAGEELKQFRFLGNDPDRQWNDVVQSYQCLRNPAANGGQAGLDGCTEYITDWIDVKVDLTPYRGQYVALKLLTQARNSTEPGVAPEDLYVLVDSLFLH